MCRKALLSICLVLLWVALAGAEESSTNAAGAANEGGDPDAKLISGMSIVGNKEAPMSLFIVPWKVSELGAETSLNRTLDARAVPVDRDVFNRELAFYQVSVGGTGPASR